MLEAQEQCRLRVAQGSLNDVQQPGREGWRFNEVRRLRLAVGPFSIPFLPNQVEAVGIMVF